MQITTIGLDIAKDVFQVHGIDANETAVLKRLRRSQVLAFFKASGPSCDGPHNAARRVKDRLLNLGRSCKSISRNGPFRTHGLRFIPETWVTLLLRRDWAAGICSSSLDHCAGPKETSHVCL